MHEAFYTELTEVYILKVLEYPSKKVLIELKLTNIDSIVMKNIIQRQMLISAEGGRVKLLLEIQGATIQGDHYF